MGINLRGDYALHPPSGSSVPGMREANPYMVVPPRELRLLIEKEQDPEKKNQMISALKQFERQYVYPGYPYKIPQIMKVLSKFRVRCAELSNPAVNVPFYQDSETNQGQEEIIDSLKGLYDNEDAEKFDYNRHGLRPIRDIDIGEGDFLTPTESPCGPTVKDREADPDGLDYEEPPTGGDNYEDVYKP